MLASLPPALLAEAQALRERAQRIQRDALGARRATQRTQLAGNFAPPRAPPRTYVPARVDRDVWLLSRISEMTMGDRGLLGGPSSLTPEMDGQLQVQPSCLTFECHAVQARDIRQALAECQAGPPSEFAVGVWPCCSCHHIWLRSTGYVHAHAGQSIAYRCPLCLLVRLGCLCHPS